jgi:hypothetical protein
MRGGRWVLAIGAWTMCTAAVSVFGIDRVSSVREELLQATSPRAVAPNVSPAPSPAPGGPKVLGTPGGSVAATCDAGMVWVQWLSPANGFHIEGADQGPGAESHVTFKTDGQEVRVVVRCTADGPYADVTSG